MIDYKNKMDKLTKQRKVVEIIQLIIEASLLFGVLAFLQTLSAQV